MGSGAFKFLFSNAINYLKIELPKTENSANKHCCILLNKWWGWRLVLKYKKKNNWKKNPNFQKPQDPKLIPIQENAATLRQKPEQTMFS